MPLDISSALAKIGRAEELLHGLDNEVRAWQDTKPYTFAKNINAELTRYAVVASVHNAPPIVRWSLIISDIVHNLRCALDHLLYAIAIYESANTDGLQFPINNAPLNSDERRRIISLSDGVRAAIESVQPYNRGNPSLPQPPLSILRNIDNTNKHKLLMLALSSVHAGKIGIKWEGVQEAPKSVIYTGDIKDGTEVIVVTFPFPYPNVKLEVLKLSCIIALKHPSPNAAGGDRDDYGALLDIIIQEVKFVMDTIVAAVH